VSDYVVAVKPSARRTNGAVGRLVNREGPHHAFPGRPAAESWARELSERGDRHVWVRAANPDDASDADAYLVGRYGRHELDGPREAADVEATEGLGTFADGRGDGRDR